MALKTAEDKAKVRTAIKIFLALKGDATAKQLSEFIIDLDLKLRANISPTIIATELDYCMREGYNFLRVGCYRDKRNIRRYYLENKEGE